MSTPQHGLSKSRFAAGLQCPRQLWWRVHERDAPELRPTPALQVLFDQGRHVGTVARQYVPGGTLIEVAYDRYDERVAATRQAIEAGAPVVYEASFHADNVFVAVDISSAPRTDGASSRSSPRRR